MTTKLHILICDDERGIRESLRMILEPRYLLSYVTNGEEVLEFLKTETPNLLIMDVKMPRLGGLDALPRIRQAEPKLPILIITGYESRDVATEALARGATAYLTKPFERHRVAAEVQALLKQN